MKKSLKVKIIGGFVCVGIISSLLIAIFYLRQPPLLDPNSNTYVENSNIEWLEYSLLFKEGNILIEDSLEISSGKLNGYSATNSTILQNSVINENVNLASIDLHNEVYLTLRNIHDVSLKINLFDRTILRLERCSIGQIIASENSSIIIGESEVGDLIGDPIELQLDESLFQMSILIENNSVIHYLSLSQPSTFVIKSSTINYMELASFYPLIFGRMQNSSISRLNTDESVFLNIYGSTISNLNVKGRSYVILNKSIVVSNLYHGINIYSGFVNVTGDKIDGTTYINNTEVIDSFVNNNQLKSITVNNSATVNINNITSTIHLYDFAKVTIRNTRGNMLDKFIDCILYDSSELIIKNCSSVYLKSYDNSSVIIQENAFITDLWLDTSNNVMIDNSSIELIGIFSESVNKKDNIFIYNSNISDFLIWPTSRVYIENCTIESLFEGVTIDSGTLIINSTGISGSSMHSNYTILLNNNIISRSLKFIEITNSTHLIIQDTITAFNLILKNNATATLDNCTIEYIKAIDSSIIEMRNNIKYYKTNYPIGQIDLHDNTQLLMDENDLYYGFSIFLFENSSAIIKNSKIQVVYLIGSPEATITESEIANIYVWASSSKGYSLKLYNSKVVFLRTSSWC